MCTQCRIFVLVLFCLFLLVCGQTTTTPSCDTSTQCSLNDTLLIDITCTESSYGQTNISDCYDQYFSFSYCKCTDPNGVISATNVTYWCNTGGQWDPGLFSLVCYASCTTDAESNVISQNPAGEETNIILHGQYVNYSCPEGYTGVGTRLVPCVDGSWGDHETYDCLGSCSLPDNYEFVDSSVTDPVPHGTVVEIKCIDGYTPSDPITSECNDGVFQDADTCRIQGEASTTTKQSTNLISSQRPEATTAAGGTLTNTDASLSTTHSQTKLVTFLTETDATRRSTTDLVTYAVTDSRPLSTQQNTIIVEETGSSTNTATTETAATKAITDTDTETVTDGATQQVTKITDIDTESATNGVPFTTFQVTEFVTETGTMTDVTGATETATDGKTEPVTENVKETDHITDQVVTDDSATEVTTNAVTEPVTEVKSRTTDQTTESVEKTDLYATESITETDTETATEIISFTTEQVTDSVGETDLTTDQVITENDATESITETDTGTVTAVTNLATKQVTEIVEETEVVTDQVITETDATESITETDTETATEIISFTTEQVTDSVGETDLITDRVITETDATESITGETEVMTDHVVTDQVVTETGLTTAVTETDTVTTTKVASLTTELLTEIVRETDPVTGQVVTETDATESITETDTETATEFISLPTEQVTNIVSETEGISLTSEQVTEIVGESDSVTDQVVTETDATESITTSDTETATDVISLATEQATKTGEITELVTDQMVTDTDFTGATTQSNTAILTGSKAITESDTATATETTPTSTQQYTNDIEPTSILTDEVITVTDALTDSSSSARSIVTGTAGTITDRFGTDATETTSNMTATSGLGAETDVVTRVTLTSVTAPTNSSPERSTETATDASVPTVTNTRVTEVPTSHPTVTSSAGSETPEMQYTTTAFTGPYKTDNRTTTFTTEPVVTTEPITTAPTSTSCENPLTNQEDTDVVDVTPYKFMYENGVEIKYFCPSGYSLEGESIAVCDSGSWNPPGLPSCKAILCPKPEINDSNVVLEPSEENYEQGADVEFTCPDGLILVGIQTATCDDGGFILEEEPQCVETVDSSLCSQPETSGEVIITPSLTFYDVGDVVTFSCANIGLTLSSTQSANCSSSGQWSVPIPTCELCKINEKGQCSGKSNNVCNGETGLCTCPPGQVLNGDRCITKTAIITIATLEGNFTSDLEDSSSEYYDTLGAEICLAFQTTLTKRNTNVKLGFVSCFVLSFTSGSIVANVATEYDEAANVTADQVTDILLVELQGNKNQLGNYSIPGLSLNFSSAPNSSETVITNNACETKTDICDPTYGMCTFLNGSLYTCSCIDAYDYYEQSISTVPGVACFVLDGPNYSLVIGLALGISLVLMASIMFGVAVLGPWCTKRNHKTYINRKKSLSDGSEDDTANRNDYVNGAYTINALENGDLADKYLEAPVDEKKMEAIASIIEHMGETAPIPRAVLMEETSFSSRESESNNGVHQPPN